jgi:CRISPR/Cas system-associated exonuclease Cas4 (RecB family)
MTTGKLTKLLDSQPAPKEEPRKYIGASSIGSQCMRQIWYAYNGYEGEAITPRLARIFETGHLLERLVIKRLIDAGVSLTTNIPQYQDKELSFFRGTMDAVWHDNQGRSIAIIEIKTTNNSRFNQFVKNGLLKWQPSYYAQVQAYMGMSGINKSYVLALNKDTSQLHDESVDFNPVYYEGLQLKAEMIHAAQEPPPKVNDNKAFYLCKMCRYRRVCHD